MYYFSWQDNIVILVFEIIATLQFVFLIQNSTQISCSWVNGQQQHHTFLAQLWQRVLGETLSIPAVRCNLVIATHDENRCTNHHLGCRPEVFDCNQKPLDDNQNDNFMQRFFAMSCNEQVTPCGQPEWTSVLLAHGVTWVAYPFSSYFKYKKTTVGLNTKLPPLHKIVKSMQLWSW